MTLLVRNESVKLLSRFKGQLSIKHRTRLRRIRDLLLIVPNYFYDLRRFVVSSMTVVGAADAAQKRALVMLDAHKIEKGLAMPEPRKGFGKEVIARLRANVNDYECRHGKKDAMVTAARLVLAEYDDFNREGGHPIGTHANKISHSLHGRGPAGTELLSREDLFPCSTEAAIAFLKSRRSARQYNGRSLSEAEITTAIALAQCAPSVCNRQAARAYVSNDAAAMRDMLRLQNGNRGFGEQLGAVFLVVSDLRVFENLGERNQGWIDGGIFAMSLVLGLHAQGIGSCMLNWSVNAAQDKIARRLLKIPQHEAIITMIGAGQVCDEIRVAASPRRPISDVLQWIPER